MLTRVSDAGPLVRRAAPLLVPFSLEVWLVSHQKLKTSRRVRLVFDWLTEALGSR